jgi:RNA polymerase sigma factor (sigma-70 family)
MGADRFYGVCMQDREIVAAIVARDPGGLAAAYDRYAPSLHAYCRSLLREPADAADVVQDTFVIAAGKLGGLREPGRLRPWLYAVARNECLRRLRARVSSVPLAEAGEVTDGEPGLGAGAEQAGLRSLVAAALAGLNPGDREVIELTLRHDLDGDDLAAALGVPRNQAYALASRARAQFSTSLGALLVARGGRGTCAELDAILAGWDGGLTVLLRKRLNRHIERCRVCGERRRRQLSPAMLLAMLPIVLLPPGLRERVFHVVTDPSLAAAAYRARVVRRAGRFTRSGFPQPFAVPRRGPGPAAQALATAGTAVFLAALGAGALLVLAALHHRPPPVALVIGPSATTVAPRSSTAAATGEASPPVAASPLAAASPGGQATPVTSSSPPAAPASPTPSGSTSPPASPSPSPSHSLSPTPLPGTPEPAPTTVVLAQAAAGDPYTGTFTVTAQGGPVQYSISDPAPTGDLDITPSSDSLAEGQQDTVTVTVVSGTGLGYQTALTLSPGGATVIIEYPPAG